MDEERCGTCHWQKPTGPCKEMKKSGGGRRSGDYDWCAAWKSKYMKDGSRRRR